MNNISEGLAPTESFSTPNQEKREEKVLKIIELKIELLKLQLELLKFQPSVYVTHNHYSLF